MVVTSCIGSVNASPGLQNVELDQPSPSATQITHDCHLALKSLANQVPCSEHASENCVSIANDELNWFDVQLDSSALLLEDPMMDNDSGADPPSLLCNDFVRKLTPESPYPAEKPFNTMEQGVRASLWRPKQALELDCPYPDCNHEGNFRRQYELDRHIRVKHEAGEQLPCPFPGCLKGPNTPNFSRPDKLTAHVRITHRRQREQKLKCPADGCAEPAAVLHRLGMHIRKKHLKRSSDYHPGILTALANASSPSHCQCPLVELPTTIAFTIAAHPYHESLSGRVGCYVA